MRKLQLVLAALMLVVSATTASAQERRAAGGNRLTALLQGITLTAEQQAKVDTIAQKANAAMQAVRADTALGEGRRARIMELMNKQTEDVKCLLTADQQRVLDKNLADMQARAQAGAGRPPER